MSINRVYISGTLARDAEFKTMKKCGNALVFEIAVGSRQNLCDDIDVLDSIIDCVMLGECESEIASIMKEGMLVAVAGSLQQAPYWKDEYSHIVIIADSVKLFQDEKEGVE